MARCAGSLPLTPHASPARTAPRGAGFRTLACEPGSGGMLLGVESSCGVVLWDSQSKGLDRRSSSESSLDKMTARERVTVSHTHGAGKPRAEAAGLFPNFPA